MLWGEQGPLPEVSVRGGGDESREHGQDNNIIKINPTCICDGRADVALPEDPNLDVWSACAECGLPVADYPERSEPDVPLVRCVQCDALHEQDFVVHGSSLCGSCADWDLAD
jgi:hypothetical protein